MISIIIPTYNCADEILGLLESVRRTELHEYEVLVVDDASTDNTVAVCEACAGVEVLRLPENRGPATARNVAACQARGEILFFVDSDVTLPADRDVLAEMAAVLERDAGVDCVISMSDIEPRRPGAVAYNTSVYHWFYMQRFLKGASEASRLMFFTTRLGAVRTERFRQSGGFHESLGFLMNEDGEFGTRCYHQGFNTYLNARFVHSHRYPTGFLRFVRSYYGNALVQALIDKKYDTSADESVSSAEKGRRLFAATAFLLPLLPLLGWLPAAALLAGWVTIFFSMFGPINRLVWRHVPARYWPGWYSVYIAITPFIFAGYAVGLLRHFVGRSPLRRPPSGRGLLDGAGR